MLKKRNVKGLSVASAVAEPPPPAPAAVSASPLVAKLNQLEINTEYKLALSTTELEDLGELGAGNGGTVNKARHRSADVILAHKVGTGGAPPPPPPGVRACALAWHRSPAPAPTARGRGSRPDHSCRRR